MVNFQKQINQNNYQNWEKIKEKYEKKELINPIKNDKYYDENKIWEILNINRRNVKNKSYKNFTEGNKQTDLILPENKRICIFKSEDKDGKKIFSPIKFKEDENI